MPYDSVVWQVRTPNNGIFDTVQDLEIDRGDGTLTDASLSYTFPAGVTGTYTIMAYVWYSDLSARAMSYDVDVTVRTPIYIADSSTRILVPASGSNYYATVGSTHEASLTSSVAYDSVVWQVRTPSNTSHLVPTVETDTGDGTLTDASLSYTFPAGVTGTYTIMAYVWYSDLSARAMSYDVTVTLSPGLRPINGSTSFAYSGEAYEMGLVTDAPYSQVIWYVKTESISDFSTYGTLVETDTAAGTATEAELSYTFSNRDPWNPPDYGTYFQGKWNFL